MPAQPIADAGSTTTNDLRWQTLARTYAEFQQRSLFLNAIEKAQKAADHIEPELDTTNNQFTLIGVLQEKGQGHTLLGEPQKALDIYRESERIQPFRPIRDLGVLTILKAQAYAYNGNIDKGVNLALRGLTLAKEYHSKRHISRIQRMYDRLLVTPLGKHPGMQDLEEALRQQTT